MSELLKFEPELEFFGTMNGASEEHTNAVFQPDEETIVFVDLSLLNAYKAERWIQTPERLKLKNFYLCLTHNHFDHASGIGKLAFDVKVHFPGHRLMVIVDERIREETIRHLDAEGLGRIVHHEHGCDDKRIYDLMSFDMYGTAYTFYDEDGTPLNKLSRPDWFVRTLPTPHSPRLAGTSGFAFNVNHKLVIYSGDSAQLEPFMSFLRVALDGHTDGDPEIEFYLDVATRKSDRHLNFLEIAEELKILLEEYPTLKLILMHYDNREKLRTAAEEKLPEKLHDRVMLANRIYFGNEFFF